MATYSKPTLIPRWADDLVNNLEPPEGKKDLGWVFEEVPPSAFENWKAQLIGQWFKWLDERLEDGATDDILQTKMPLSIHDLDNFVLEVDTDPFIRFKGLGSNTYIKHDQANDEIEFWVNGTEQLRLTPTAAIINADLELGDDLTLAGGLRVGFTGTPTDDRIELGDDACYWDFNSGNPVFYFDTDGGASGFTFVRGTDLLSVLINGSSEFEINASTINAKTNNFYTEGQIGRDSTDYISWVNNTSMALVVNGQEECRVVGTGLNIRNGLHVGHISTAPVDNEIKCDGAIRAGAGIYGTSGNFGTGTVTCGLVNASDDVRISTGGLRVGDTFTTNPGYGEGIFEDGLAVGIDLSPTTRRITLGDANSYWDHTSSEIQLLVDENDWFEFRRDENVSGGGIGGTYKFVIGTSEKFKMYRHATFGWAVLEWDNGDYIYSNSITPGLAMIGCSVQDSGNANGGFRVSGPNTGTSPTWAAAISYDNGFGGGRGLVIDAQWASGRYAHLNCEPTAIDGVGTLPGSGERFTGDVFAGTEGGTRIWFFNGSSWSQMG